MATPAMRCMPLGLPAVNWVIGQFRRKILLMIRSNDAGSAVRRLSDLRPSLPVVAPDDNLSAEKTAPRASEPASTHPAAWITLFLLIAGIATATGVYFYLPPAREFAFPGVVETQEVRLGSKIGGRVAQVLVKEGDMVEPGQLLARLDTPELEAQRAQCQAILRAAEADFLKAKNGPRAEEREAGRLHVEAAKARLQRLKTGYRPEEIKQAKGDLEMAEADQKLAQQELDRVNRLIKQRSVSQTDQDSAQANLNRSAGRLSAARAKWEMLTAGNRQEDVDESTAEVQRAEANYNLLLAGTRVEDIASAEAKVHETAARLRELDANLEEARVKAHEKAIVEIVTVRPGDIVSPNQPMIRILRADDLWVRIYVPETELGKLRLNQKVTIRCDTYPDHRFHGVVRQIASISEFTPRNVQSLDGRRHQVFGVKVHVDDPNGIFKSGMAAEVIVPLPDAAAASAIASPNDPSF